MPLEVQIKQSGGWGNPLAVMFTVSDANLPADEAREFRRLWDAAHAANPNPSVNPHARDARTYEIVVRDDTDRHSFSIDDTSMGNALGALIEFVRAAARRNA